MVHTYAVIVSIDPNKINPRRRRYDNAPENVNDSTMKCHLLQQNFVYKFYSLTGARSNQDVFGGNIYPPFSAANLPTRKFLNERIP
ncbi:MAG: hypothetical protein CM1200mP22_23540 [Dehalococcoidia bacterium]|nr:MAG: hypothetical protein CM1200mP22_23540 [Dehalococcoidia bacterium]